MGIFDCIMEIVYADSIEKLKIETSDSDLREIDVNIQFTPVFIIKEEKSLISSFSFFHLIRGWSHVIHFYQLKSLLFQNDQERTMIPRSVSLDIRTNSEQI